MSQVSLYERLGGYDGFAAFTNDLLPRLQADPQLGRFWQNRGDDGIAREHQLHYRSPPGRTTGAIDVLQYLIMISYSTTRVLPQPTWATTGFTV